MKSIKLTKILSFVLAAALIFSTLAVAVFAAQDGAAAFNNAVSSLKSATTLESKESRLNTATTALNTYLAGGGAVTDDAISDSYAYYSEVKPAIEESVSACRDFMSFVSLAVVETNTYIETRAYLDSAQALLDKIDENYGDVKIMMSEYDTLTNKLKLPEANCKSYLSYAEAAANGKTYKEILENYERAQTAKNLVEIEDYPGLDVADGNMKIATNLMANITLDTKPFLDAVKSIGKAKTIPLGIKNARSALLGVDLTAPGVSNAIKNIDKAERNYDKEVKDCNSEIEEANELIFAIIF